MVIICGLSYQEIFVSENDTDKKTHLAIQKERTNIASIENKLLINGIGKSVRKNILTIFYCTIHFVHVCNKG